mmetsp:Transcript_24438/g.44197  ORF Transcript_24438/g.44197 Transcript_24438/m.44197 type:complete len:103 (+) Transcript_24438:82-390(+)
MPPKKVKKPKPKRVPHANETPLKDKQPGHGAVERSKNQMWSEPSSAAQQTSRSNVPVARPKYKATSTIGIGIGRGGGGGGVKKKNAAPAVTAVVSTTIRRPT